MREAVAVVVSIVSNLGHVSRHGWDSKYLPVYSIINFSDKWLLCAHRRGWWSGRSFGCFFSLDCNNAASTRSHERGFKVINNTNPSSVGNSPALAGNWLAYWAT
jgi:hypothetical protein